MQMPLPATGDSVLFFEEIATLSCAWPGRQGAHVSLTLELASVAVTLSLGLLDAQQADRSVSYRADLLLFKCRHKL